MGGGQRSPWADYSKNRLLRNVLFLLPLKHLHWLLAAISRWRRWTTSYPLRLPPAARPEHLPTRSVPAHHPETGVFTFPPHSYLAGGAAASLAPCSNLLKDHRSFGVSGVRGYQIASSGSPNAVPQAGGQLWRVGAAREKASAQAGAESQLAHSL